MSADCIFCKIAGGAIPAEIVHRDEQVTAFRDINPVAPVSSGNVAGVFARPASGYQQIGYTPRREFGLNIRYAFGAR